MSGENTRIFNCDKGVNVLLILCRENKIQYQIQMFIPFKINNILALFYVHAPIYVQLYYIEYIPFLSIY